MRKTLLVGALAATVVAVAGTSATAGVVTNTPAPTDHRVTICHAVAADNGGNTGNGYNIETVDKDSISTLPNGHDGHDNIGGSGRSDIIPAFAAGATSGPPPKSWNAYGGKGDASLIGSGCVEEQPPADVFAAAAVCDEENFEYDVTGTVNGDAAAVNPATIAGDFSGTTEVAVSKGEKSGTATVTTDGTCVEETEEPTEVTASVSFTNATCQNPAASVTTVPVTGVKYDVTGTVAPGQTVTVTATATSDDYVLVGQTVWEFTFAAAPTNCTPPPGTCPDGGPPNEGKDGDVPGSGDTNNDCDRSVVPPTPPTASTPPAPPAPPVTPPAPPATPPVTPPAPTPKPNKPPKATTKPPKSLPKPDAPPAATPPQTTSTTAEKLPFTGLGLGWTIGFGVLLSAAGLMLRRVSG